MAAKLTGFKIDIKSETEAKEFLANQKATTEGDSTDEVDDPNDTAEPEEPAADPDNPDTNEPNED